MFNGCCDCCYNHGEKKPLWPVSVFCIIRVDIMWVVSLPNVCDSIRREKERNIGASRWQEEVDALVLVCLCTPLSDNYPSSLTWLNGRRQQQLVGSWLEASIPRKTIKVPLGKPFNPEILKWSWVTTADCATKNRETPAHWKETKQR